MSVVVMDLNNPSADGNLSTVNGFYRAEAYNFGAYFSTLTSLSTARTIAFTPLNAGNAQGAIICFHLSSIVAASIYKDCTVKLQENVASVWTDRASKTLTANEMFNSMPGTLVGGYSNGVWAVPFRFTAPYAITAAAATWRIEVSNSGGGGTNLDIRTSDGTNMFYVLWADNQVSYTDNTDQPVAVDPITIDQTATFKGILSTGNTTQSMCALACRNTDPTPANVCNFVWENPPAAAYTLTIDGYFGFSSHSGLRIGTSGSPIPLAQIATVQMIAATSGTSTNTGFVSIAATSSTPKKMSMFFYGAVPAESMVTTSTYPINFGATATMTIASPCVVTKSGTITGTVMYFTTTGALPTGVTSGTDYFAGNVSGSTFNLYDTYANAIAGGATGRVNTSGSQSGTHTSNTVIHTDTTTGWAINDRIVTGRQNIIGGPDRLVNTIASISGTRITLNTNLAGQCRFIKAPVVRLNGYGIVIQGPSDTVGVQCLLTGATNLVSSGVYYKYAGLTHGAAGTQGSSYDADANRQALQFSDVSYESASANSVAPFSYLTPQTYTPVLERLYFHRGVAIAQTQLTTTFTAPTIKDSYFIVPTSFISNMDMNNAVIDNCEWHNSSGTIMLTLNRANVTLKNCEFWGANATAGAVSMTSLFFQNTNSGNNIFCSNLLGIGLTGTVIGGYSADDIFGTAATNGVANTADIGINTAATETYFQMLFISPQLTTVTTTNLSASLLGTNVSITDFNNSSLDDRDYLTWGYYQRTGTGLTDTTCRTSGGYAIRLEPTSGTIPLTWPVLSSLRIVPTGNIQNKTMTITAWIYINNTAYDAGTYILPSMNVKYDNATTVTATCTATFGSWQQLALNFTPSTTYGQIELWFSGATDATTSNAYFYIDDVNIAYPAGVIVNNGPLDAWANAVPVWPPTASIANQTNFWDELKTNHTVSGSFGLAIADTEVEAKNFLAGDKMEGA